MDCRLNFIHTECACDSSCRLQLLPCRCTFTLHYNSAIQGASEAEVMWQKLLHLLGVIWREAESCIELSLMCEPHHEIGSTHEWILTSNYALVVLLQDRQWPVC